MRWHLLGRLEQGEVFFVAAHPAPMGLPEAKAMELTGQKAPRCAVLLGRLIEINDGDARPRTQRWQEIEERAIRLSNLMVHMDHEDKVHGTERQSRIVRFPEHKGYIVQSLRVNPFLKFRQISRHHVLSQNAATWPNALRKPDRVIACASSNIRNRHARTYAEKIHDLFRLAIPAAGLLSCPFVGQNPHNRAARRRKELRWHARRPDLQRLSGPLPERCAT